MANGANLILQAAQAGLQNVAPVTNLLAGLESANVLKQQGLQNQLLQQQLAQQQAQAPIQQQLLQQRLQAGEQGLQAGQFELDQAQRQAMFSNIVSIAGQAKLLPPESRQAFLESEFANMPGSNELIADVKSMASSQSALDSALDSIIDLGVQQGILKGAAPVQFGAQETFRDEEGNLFFGTQQKDPQGRSVKTVFSPFPGGPEQPVGRVRIVDESGMTHEEKAQIDVAKAKEKADIEISAAAEIEEQKGLGKARGERSAKVIELGADSAKGVATIKRSLELLETVRTSGFNEALLSVKRFAGVEGADEGELAQNLGKAVLAQLRDVFGAQFTVEEGKRLERIEAGMGKGVEANKRLLNNLLQFTIKKSEDGIEEAVRVRDFATADRIQKDLDFVLDADFSFAPQQKTSSRLDELREKAGL